MKLLAGVLLCGVSSLLHAQAPPSTDIHVAALRDSGGRLVLGAVRNVTARAGYDNQPAWGASGSTLYYSSQRGDAQNDIWQVDLTSGAHTRLTMTAPESEYSPTLMPGGVALSVVKVERDSSQRLWRVPLDGSAASVLLAGVKPVGYHAWGNDSTLVMFVLGSPATLQVANTRSGIPAVAARDIQRGLARIPGQAAVSYVARVSREASWIMRYDLATGDTTRIAPALPGVPDHAWTPSGALLAARESKLFAWNATAGWVEVGDLAAAGVRGITRLAVSPRGDAIALVAQDRSP